MEKLRTLIKSYETWVAANAETVCDVEMTTKWVSYFIAGRISDSSLPSELIYSLSNILVLYNDRIIDKARNEEKTGSAAHTNSEQICYRLKVMLTTLEYSEVFIEISAKRIFGTKGKWIFVTILQLAKAASRFFILKHSTEQIITSPAMPSLNRRLQLKQQKSCKLDSSAGIGAHNATTPAEHSFTFKLKRSGRVVRKIEGAPPLQYRDFKLHDEVQAQRMATMPKSLLQAEYFYIAKPLIHLTAMAVFGEKRWKQFAIALALDLFSIRQYHKNRHLMSKQQKLEMSRRCINMLLYLMRSPFYEYYTQSRIERVLGFVADNVPLVRMIAGPLKEYIPHWQNTYFYLWST